MGGSPVGWGEFPLVCFVCLLFWKMKLMHDCGLSSWVALHLDEYFWCIVVCMVHY
jgi:hypothetical protein